MSSFKAKMAKFGGWPRSVHQGTSRCDNGIVDRPGNHGWEIRHEDVQEEIIILMGSETLYMPDLLP